MRIVSYIFIFVFIWLPFTGNSQITFSAKDKVCLGDITTFNFKTSGSATVNSIKWSFGNGSSSTQLSPAFLYKNKGRFLVKVEVQTSTGVLEDTLTIEVVGLPTAKIGIVSTSDFCHLSNNICIQDSSFPFIPEQTLENNLLIWGDGNFEKYDETHSGYFCHKYATVGGYSISLEVQDKYGCKGFDKKTIDILPDVATSFTKMDSNPSCNKRKFCFTNSSKVSPGATANYRWEFNGTTSNLDYFDSMLCKAFTGAVNLKAKLIGTAQNGCSDTASFNLHIPDQNVKGDLFMYDSIGCFGSDSIKFELKNFAGQIKWYINNSELDKEYKPILNLNFRKFGVPVGKNTLRCEITNGLCVKNIERTIHVLGPKADFEILYNEQCRPKQRVFFLSESEYEDTANTTFFWDLEDPYGGNCTNTRVKDINLYKNCNYSTDWYTKHDYTEARSDYKAHFTIRDTKTGCFDTMTKIVDMNNCGVARQFCDDTLRFCEGDKFFPNPGTGKQIYQVSLDSGLTWRDFPTPLRSSDRGLHAIGFVFEDSVKRSVFDFGDDSITIEKRDTVLYDTVLCNAYIHVYQNVMDSIYLDISQLCDSTLVTLNFKSGKFYAGEIISFIWQPGVKTNMLITKDTIIKKVSMMYYKTLRNHLFEFERFNPAGTCSNSFFELMNFGIESTFSLKGASCTSNEICFNAAIRDNAKNKLFTENNPFHNVSWELNGTPFKDSLYSMCHQFTSGGMKVVQMIVAQEIGCKDTVVDSVFIQKVKADITHGSTFFFCNQNRQFFDSSSFLYSNALNDSFVNFYWEFDNGDFKSVLKNPFHSFVGEIDDVKGLHAVETEHGCTDTTRFILKLIGSKPRFEILDSIGCVPLKVNFKNTSLASTSYIWEFNDPGKNTLNTNNANPVSFTYNTPGVYYPKLVGIDTIYNPVTSSVYYCNASYPKGDSVIKVVVLPVYNTGIQGPDTLCVNQEGAFLSKSDKEYDYDHWDMGNQDSFRLNTGKDNVYSYSAAGKYKVRLNPFYPVNISSACIDSAEKEVVVNGIRVDFDIDMPLNPPIFSFTNSSSSLNANFLWDFGQPKSSTNSSTDIHASHNYAIDTGWYSVCLMVESPDGCKDTMCKKVYNDYWEGVIVYNVFTPDNNDGYNDDFDVVIEGESYYNMVVTNRWGQEVFHSKEDDYNWNGRIENELAICPSGTYYYVFIYSWANDPEEKITVHGVVTLIRE